ncbi:hypothetical protein DERP_000929 [Dermatophagoides pteronyssinus]|uniref:Ionotropic glutamate receptor L-glutamate and glycine-binding domain-containing protein n=1 Tax=Dermatophagoides pteronyssinus TaxID=6956 RepID=A0ABQ8JD13_DERPT|nr:hypothetical protein DERP_000929 [Dermatophagoides pteronyssinus]
MKTLNISNQIIRIGFFNVNPPFVWLKSNQTDYYNVDGIESKIINLMQQNYGFKIEWFITNERYGNKKKKVFCSGLFEFFFKKKIDMAIGGISQTKNRIDVVDFLESHDQDRLTFAITDMDNRLGLHQTYNFDLLWKPFMFEVWMILLSMFVLFGLFDQFRLKLFKRKKFNNKNDYLIWINLSLLFKVTYYRLNKINTSIKICSIIWTLSSIVINNVYIGQLHSLMTLPSERTGIITIDEFAHACSMGQILPILIKNSAVITTLSQSNIQSFQMIYQQARLIPDRETALKSQYLHIVSILLNDHHHHHHHQDNRLLHIAPDTIGSSFYSIITAIPVRKSFPFRKTFGKL